MPSLAPFAIVLFLSAPPGMDAGVTWRGQMDTERDCKVAAEALAALMPSGRVTCETAAGDVIAEWMR